mmetsp:Transcript_109437/g.304483  ORF Transcript_109437/g.304483 Transcript_109437/m.304483 type:complete len:279 (+) Transcript_109437:221-1057(+)
MLHRLKLRDTVMQRRGPTLRREVGVPKAHQEHNARRAARPLENDLVLEAVVEEEATALLPRPPLAPDAEPRPGGAGQAEVASQPRVARGAVRQQVRSRRQRREDDLAGADARHGHRAGQQLLEDRASTRTTAVYVRSRLGAEDHILAPLASAGDDVAVLGRPRLPHRWPLLGHGGRTAAQLQHLGPHLREGLFQPRGPGEVLPPPPRPRPETRHEDGRPLPRVGPPRAGGDRLRGHLPRLAPQPSRLEEHDELEVGMGRGGVCRDGGGVACLGLAVPP